MTPPKKKAGKRKPQPRTWERWANVYSDDFLDIFVHKTYEDARNAGSRDVEPIPVRITEVKP